MKGYNIVLLTIFFLSLFCESFLGQLFIFIFVPFTTKIILGLQKQTCYQKNVKQRNHISCIQKSAENALKGMCTRSNI